MLIVTKKERYYTPISNFSPQKAIKLNSKSIKLTNWVKRVRVIKKMRVGWRIVAEIFFFAKTTILFNQLRPINTSVSYKQSPLFLPLLRGEVCCIAIRKLISRHSKDMLLSSKVCCIATQKLISREHSTIVKEKLNMFQ